jgi:UDP-N-acetylmuramate dehydrogenase
MNIQQNISLKPYNTFGIDVQAKYFASFQSIDELKEFINYKQTANRKLVLGGGSNILFTKN